MKIDLGDKICYEEYAEIDNQYNQVKNDEDAEEKFLIEIEKQY